jgi:hypothetical protein
MRRPRAVLKFMFGFLVSRSDPKGLGSKDAMHPPPECAEGPIGFTSP